MSFLILGFPSSTMIGLPDLQSAYDYRILDENVQINVRRDGRVDVYCTTVYRNQGPKTTAKIFLARSTAFAQSDIAVTWDKKKVATTLYGPSGGGVYLALNVNLEAQATHSLTTHLVTRAVRSGYSKDQYKVEYGLNGNHPIELFSLAYRTAPDTVFGLPKLEPDLGWEIGDHGASIRKENFNPGNSQTSFEFYSNSLAPLGQG